MSADAQTASGQNVPVVLVNMPFGPLATPALGLSMLKSALRTAGISSRIFYFHILFAKQFGVSLYESVAGNYSGVTDLTGDWLFSHTLFENKPDDTQRYVSSVLRRPRLEQALSWAALEGYIAELLMARVGVSSFVDACVETLLQTGARIVGFTSVYQQNVAALAVAQRLKRRRPDILTLFGGANFEGITGQGQFEHFPFIDVAISGEAEQRLPWVVERLLRGERLGKLVGVLAREHLSEGPRFTELGDTQRRDLDSLPVPDFSDFFTQWEEARLEGAQKPAVPFETSRGCWWGQKQHCTFCGLNGESMTYRSKSPQRALTEFTEVTQAHPGHRVTVVDNILDMKYFKTFIQELGARSNPVEIFYEVKANLTHEQVRLLKAARVLTIQPGIENLSDQILRLMRKGVTGMQNLQLMKWCKEYGITPLWNMLWGFPGEEPEEYARLAELFPLLTHLTPPLMGVSILLERFSPNFNEARARGFKDVRPAPAYFFIYDLPEEALQNIAYFFSYQYEDGRDVWAYVKPVAQRIKEWLAEHDTSALYSLDKKDHLLIIDRRKVAPSPSVILQGAERWALQACEAVTTLQALEERYLEQEPAAQDWDALENVLARLVEAKLLITDGKHYLGLPVAVTQDPLAAPVPPLEELGAPIFSAA
ncbi:RiPP maturation radical SAM C-methyltransferase [Hyalangium sp.]|uniref:RiPP maturation radical SAM C-methyltransferase n=1 Tax=Hyalangium sp. TaxID=2028555 RepID=UPI002D71B5D2|nr:RiPP maturation radical SAM C-methyltransferase [Hyalangium sp.]HYI02755.1 RiPP maturation radical SAM C-methyltransferase [Hyalangium sp.]